jgi:macrodomain Ter protein organizer (MatP/YcbG family)
MHRNSPAAIVGEVESESSGKRAPGKCNGWNPLSASLPTYLTRTIRAKRGGHAVSERQSSLYYTSCPARALR